MDYDEAQKITFEYSQLISSDAKKIPFFPKSKLQHSKEDISRAILILAVANQDHTEWVKSLEIFYVYLAHFIDDGDFARFCKMVVAVKETHQENITDDFNVMIESDVDLKVLWDDINSLIAKERKIKRDEFEKTIGKES
jgi:hypothetical protein